MNYANQANEARSAMNLGMGGTVGGSLAGAVATKPRLQQQLDQLDKVLACCHEVAAGLDGCADKIIGATPKEAVGGSNKPSSMTVEGRLQDAILYAEHLLHRLNDTGSRLNQAV